MREVNTTVQTKTQIRTATAVSIGLLFGIGSSSAAAGLIQFNRIQQEKLAAIVIEQEAGELDTILDEDECHPDAVEVCDGIDNDCDSQVDEAGAVGEIAWYIDEDADGWGNTDKTVLSCTQPENTVVNGFDCDDVDAEMTTECGVIPRNEE